MPNSVLAARAVTYRVRGGSTLVSGVNLEVSPGELVAVIGPNGAGKSTLLGLLAGSLLPSDGEVFLNGVRTSSSTPSELALERSILTQHEPRDIPYTAAQVVELGRFPHRREETNTQELDAEAVAKAMSQTHTAGFATRSYATLSKGEQTRVSLARVIAQATPIIFLDEPTTALDVAHQERIMSRLVEMARSAKTLVVVLHDLNAAALHARRVVVMYQGAVVADGTPRDVLRSNLLSEIYDYPMVVVDHPLRNGPLILTAVQQGST